MDLRHCCTGSLGRGVNHRPPGSRPGPAARGPSRSGGLSVILIGGPGRTVTVSASTRRTRTHTARGGRRR
eukprot:541317-Hanusia_phi.AAC.3